MLSTIGNKSHVQVRSTNEHHTSPIKSCCMTLERMTGLEPAIACLEGKSDNHYATSAKRQQEVAPIF